MTISCSLECASIQKQPHTGHTQKNKKNSDTYTDTSIHTLSHTHTHTPTHTHTYTHHPLTSMHACMQTQSSYKQTQNTLTNTHPDTYIQTQLSHTQSNTSKQTKTLIDGTDTNHKRKKKRKKSEHSRYLPDNDQHRQTQPTHQHPQGYQQHYIHKDLRAVTQDPHPH